MEIQRRRFELGDPVHCITENKTGTVKAVDQEGERVYVEFAHWHEMASWQKRREWVPYSNIN